MPAAAGDVLVLARACKQRRSLRIVAVADAVSGVIAKPEREARVRIARIARGRLTGGGHEVDWRRRRRARCWRRAAPDDDPEHEAANTAHPARVAQATGLTSGGRSTYRQLGVN